MTFVKPLFSLPAFLEQTESWQIKWIGLVVECDYEWESVLPCV